MDVDVSENRKIRQVVDHNLVLVLETIDRDVSDRGYHGRENGRALSAHNRKRHASNMRLQILHQTAVGVHGLLRERGKKEE
jgi:hypothetical protein